VNRGVLRLYTILLCTIWFGVWHESGGSEGVRISRKSVAIVLQPCARCRWEGLYKEDGFMEKSLEVKDYLGVKG